MKFGWQDAFNILFLYCLYAPVIFGASSLATLLFGIFRKVRRKSSKNVFILSIVLFCAGLMVYVIPVLLVIIGGGMGPGRTDIVN